MVLDTLQLADVTWDDLVALARRRIPAITRGEWTLHAPVDPGITMLELFAWLLEQRVYWLDQVPDTLVRALLVLLGVAPRPEGVAGTVLCFASDGGWRVAPAGTAMRVVGAQPGPVFSTDDAIAVAPVEAVRLLAGGRDRSADLAEGRWVQVLRADGGPDELELRLQLASPPPAALAAPLALLLELVAPPAMVPQWSAPLAGPPAAVFPLDPERTPSPASAPPAMRVPVQFLYRRAGTGELAGLPAFDDGTLGLRRAGIVRFQPPGDWAVEADGTRAVIVRAERTGFTVPPRVSAVRANAVVAHHGRRVVVALAASWLPLPGAHLDLPAAHGAPLPAWARVYLRERATPGRWMVWRAVDDLSTSAPDARVFRVDRARARIEFGDGLTGRQPVLAADAGPLPPPIDLGEALPHDGDPNAIVEYLVGGGVDGDLGPDQAWTAAAGAIGWEANSPVAAIGGTDAEPLADARTRAAAELRTPHRAVTRRDYQELACTTPGTAIARAFAAVGSHPGHPCREVPGATTVFVVPAAPRDEDAPPGSDLVDVRAPVPDADSLALVQDRLDRARLAGHEVFVAGPRYRDTRLRFQVETDPRSPAALAARVRAALERYLDPLQGGDDGTGWPFGEPLRPSALIRAAQAAVGREGDLRSVAIALDGAVALEVSCTDVAVGATSLPRLQSVDVDLLPRLRAREVLR